ncbi:MAG: ParB/RepB/Spo0J family partition protein [Methylobacillus sp.]|jgi:ParB family chromosome partitioning protein|nr:ParB/RepB/Spo0J family partition protein [Methylobacillus sp.]
MVKSKGLGRGLDALLGGSLENVSSGDTLRVLRVEQLQPGKYQPRTQMDEESLAQLADSIRAQGIMQPILVREIAPEKFEIIAGERRWRAAQMAGMREVQVLVRELQDETALAMSLIENIQRENLNPLEEANGIQRLLDEFGLTHQAAAEAIGRSRAAVTNLLRLRALTDKVQDMLMAGHLDMGHARALLPLDGAMQIIAAEQIAAKKLSVREAERLAQRLTEPRKKNPAPRLSRDILNLQETLADRLGASVAIRHGVKGKGKLTIDYNSPDELEGILNRMGIKFEQG